jgi:hypothetical protein
MKTTVELPEDLVKQARRVAKAESSSLRALVEEGLQRALESRRRRTVRELDFPTYGGSGLTDEFKDVDWARIRDEVYRGHGA